MTIKEALSYGIETIKNRLDAEILLCHLLKVDRGYLYSHFNISLTDDLLSEYKNYLTRRKLNEPIAYILGKKEFWSLEFLVNQHTLIPRPETELLVEITLQKFPQQLMRVLDLATGSGAVAIALAHERPSWQIYATDISAGALAVAQQNIKRHHCNNVTLIQSDWYQGLPEIKFDVIVSNPPYIPSNDVHLSALAYEPLSALTAGEDGLDAIRIIIENAFAFLTDNGWLMLEHGYDQGGTVRELLTQHGYHDIMTIKDHGDHERITIGAKKK